MRLLPGGFGLVAGYCLSTFVLVVAGAMRKDGLWAQSTAGAARGQATSTPTFYRDVLPILQGHCESCHRAGGIAPMAFESYEDARQYAAAIRGTSETRSM